MSPDCSTSHAALESRAVHSVSFPLVSTAPRSETGRGRRARPVKMAAPALATRRPAPAAGLQRCTPTFRRCGRPLHLPCLFPLASPPFAGGLGRCARANGPGRSGKGFVATPHQQHRQSPERPHGGQSGTSGQRLGKSPRQPRLSTPSLFVRATHDGLRSPTGPLSILLTRDDTPWLSTGGGDGSAGYGV